MESIRESVNEKPLQASKWLKVQALLEDCEMAELFDALGIFSLYLNGSICKKEEAFLPKTSFLLHYNQYIQQIKEGKTVNPSDYRPWFSLMMTHSATTLFATSVAENQFLIRCCKPVILIQPHQITYSSVDKKFRSMVFGTESISWGIQFSYPQIYQNPETNEIEQMKKQGENTLLFHKLQKWMRSNTIPTPFYAEEIRQNVPMRLGKHCLKWINGHAQLMAKEISVKQQ
jgi:hypothetical protein